jgi:hypothetical protein
MTGNGTESIMAALNQSVSWFVTFPEGDKENKNKFSEVVSATYPEAVNMVQKRYGVQYARIYGDNDIFRDLVASEGLTLRERIDG